MSDEPGDPVCWLAQLCPECGAMPGDGPACWRCGTAIPPAEPDERIERA